MNIAPKKASSWGTASRDTYVLSGEENSRMPDYVKVGRAGALYKLDSPY